MTGHVTSISTFEKCLIKKHNHFTFLSESPGVVSLKEYSDSPCTTFSILLGAEWCPEADDLPPLINSDDLPLARQMYLYGQICEFCREGTEDLVCPRPLACKFNTENATENADRHDVAPCSKWEVWGSGTHKKKLQGELVYREDRNRLFNDFMIAIYS